MLVVTIMVQKVLYIWGGPMGGHSILEIKIKKSTKKRTTKMTEGSYPSNEDFAELFVRLY